MEFFHSFLVNISCLIALAFIASTAYKHIAARVSQTTVSVLTIAFAIFMGWASMYFALEISSIIKFDLRFVPLLIATFLLKRPAPLIFIGVGIGLLRFTFGINDAAAAGFINLSILGFVCAVIHYGLGKANWRLRWKIAFIIVAVNLVNVVNIAVFGIIPAGEYFQTIVPSMLPLSLVLSGFFSFMVWDVRLEQERILKIEQFNGQLRQQTEELQAVSQELEEKTHQLAISSQYRSEFLANMSHELRTLLNNILLLAQLQKENWDTITHEENEHYAEMINTAANDLYRLINDIMELSKVESGKVDILFEEVNLSELPYALHRNFEQMAAQKGLSIKVVRSEDVPDILYSDAFRVQQILKTMLTNAIKLTRRGVITLEMCNVETSGLDDSPAEWIALSVSNTDSLQAQERLDMSVDLSRQANIALSICSELAKLLDGYLTFRKDKEDGLKYTLYLPCHLSERDVLPQIRHA